MYIYIYMYMYINTVYYRMGGDETIHHPKKWLECRIHPPEMKNFATWIRGDFNFPWVDRFQKRTICGAKLESKAPNYLNRCGIAKTLNASPQ